jgi:hypothetical protein
MKGKILIGLAAVLVSTGSFAMDITKGRLLDHKEWTTNGGVGTFIDKHQSLAATKANRFFHDEQFEDGVIAQGKVYDLDTAKVNEEVRVHSKSILWLVNYTQSQQIYKITTELCSNLENVDKQVCTRTEDRVSLEPKGSLSMNRYPSVHITFDKAGYYSNQMFSSVQREGMKTAFLVTDINGINVVE